MLRTTLSVALLVLTAAASPLQVTGCDLLARPERFDGKLVRFIAYRLAALDTIDYSPFGCTGMIRISKADVVRDHRYAGEGAYKSRSGLMVPATNIEGRVRVIRSPAVPGRLKALTLVVIDDARVEPAGYRLYRPKASD
jgi:hypothetical protein